MGPEQGTGSAALWRLQLTVKNGPDAGKSCTVDRDVVTVGKMPDCDLVLTDSTVSRRHLRISRTSQDEEERWVLVDLGSTNGTFLNEARIKEAPVDAGALLKAGNVEIAFAPERQNFDVPPWPENHFGSLIGRSKVMRQLFGMVARIAETDATVLIHGETGTGKGAIAREIHRASLRSDGPYIVMDSGAVQRHLVESELFGHEKGAFSGAYVQRHGAFELANGGSIFIDELGELDLDLQPKLLRVLDAREVRRIGGNEAIPVDIRVMASSRRDLSREVERGVFREDLFFRLSVVTLTIPPLRERAEDIPLLVEHFLDEISETRGVKAPRLDSNTLDRLTSHDWPGNVRELRNMIERSILLSAVRPGDRLQFSNLGSGKGEKSRAPRTGDSFDPSISFSQSKERWMEKRERAYLTWLLERSKGNVSAAAREAKMDRKYLHKLLRKYELN